MFIFLIIIIAELICENIDSLSHLHYVTKPAIVISLVLFLWMESNSISKTIRNLTLMTLIFSLIGNFFLIFVDQTQYYFRLGLTAFLIAHIMYILVYIKQGNPTKKTKAIFNNFLIVCIRIDV